ILESHRRLFPESREIETCRSHERFIEDRRFMNTRDSIASNRVVDLRDEIPDVAFRHETEWIDDSFRWAVVAVEDAHFALPPDGVLQQRQMRHLVTAAIPAADIDVDALTRQLGVASSHGGQHGEKF